MNYNMLKWAKDIFPFNRSLTGIGVRKTINYINKINPQIKKISFKSNSKVFDWIVPSEWKIDNAYFIDKFGKKYAEFKKNNLHIVSYSVPVNKTVSKNELLQHIHTLPKQPNAIPYITSYYKRNWGFCITEKVKKKLPDGNFKVKIDSKLFDGNLDIGEAYIKGKVKKEIFFSTYICHPSMANNETSGIVVLSALLKYISENYKNNYYSYRFVFVPETIGSIAYLSKNYKKMKKNIICGFNLSCVGDENAFSHVHSRFGNALSDRALKASLKGLKNVREYSFLERGSDERQYCSPGIDLPLSTFCRSKFNGGYKEYHSSLDDFKIVTSKGLDGSFNVIKNIIDSFELGLYPKSNFLCEPQLGKRNLYWDISKKENYNSLNTRRDLIAYADGKTNIFDICEIIKKPLLDVLCEYRLLSLKKILRGSN